MPSRWVSLALNTVDPWTLAPFWCEVLGYEVIEQDDDSVSIADPTGRGLGIDLLAVPEAKAVQNRLHLDLRADGTTTAAELERLLALGARHVDVGQGPDVSWVVLADPEGNEFCLLSRTTQEMEAG